MRIQRFLWLCAFTMTGLLRGQVIPTTGDGCTAPVRELMVDLMTRYQVTNAAIGVSFNGRLVATCGGGAQQGSNSAIHPNTLFRIASLTKPITAVSVLKLVDQGRLSLEAKLVDLLPEILPAGGPTDARINAITVRMLLQHSGGWDRNVAPDPMFRSALISQAEGLRGPAQTATVARYMMKQPLQFAPGTKYAYSNFGYALLGLIVQKVSGLPYERFVREEVFAPVGARGMRIGRTLPEGRTVNSSNPRWTEVTYRSPGNASSVFPFQNSVPWPYGGWYLEAMEAHGGWIASVVDMLRFLEGIDGRGGTRLLSQAAFAELTKRPELPEWATGAVWYGLGFLARTSGSDYTLWHDGSLDGATTYMARFGSGYSYVALFNTRPTGAGAGNFLNELSTGMSTAIQQSTFGAQTNLYTSNEYRFVENVQKAELLSQKGVVHGASFEPGVVAGSWATLFGWRMGPRARLWADADFQGDVFPTSLDGVEVYFNDVKAAVNYISPTQINVQVPELPGATSPVRVRVVWNGISSEVEPVELRTGAPEFFRYFVGGKAYVAAIFNNGVTVGNPALLPGVLAARPSDAIAIFGTGFQASPAGRIVRSPQELAKAKVMVGNVEATVLYTGLTAAGLFQVNITVPNLPAGEYPVTLEFNGVTSQVQGLLVVGS